MERNVICMYDESKDDDDFSQNKPFRPWVTIWLKPRETVAQAVRLQPLGLIYFLVIGVAVLEAPVSLYDSDVPYDFTGMWLIFAAVIGGVLGLLGWLLMSWLYAVVGGWFGGRGTTSDMRVGLGIAYIPAFVATVIQASSLVFVVMMYYAPTAVILSLVMVLLTMGFGIWGFVTQVLAIAEVHGFSGWRGLGTFLLAGLFVGVVIFIIAMIVFIFVFAMMI